MTQAARSWQRRAQPWLGTLVDIGVPEHVQADKAIDLAFAAIARVQRHLSRFDPQSDVSRFAVLHAGERMRIADHTLQVLTAALDLQCASDGVFDITQGLAPDGWSLDGAWLCKRDDRAMFDLGGIAKGYAVDCAVASLQACGCDAGWVNAGGDLRAFGDAEVPVMLRDEQTGGVRPFAQIADGAMATSHFGAHSRCGLWSGDDQQAFAHVSVAAPSCLWADALTKIVAASHNAAHPLLSHYGAHAWLH